MKDIFVENRCGLAPLVKEKEIKCSPERVIMLRVNERVTGFKWLRIN